MQSRAADGGPPRQTVQSVVVETAATQIAGIEAGGPDARCQIEDFTRQYLATLPANVECFCGTKAAIAATNQKYPRRQEVKATAGQ